MFGCFFFHKYTKWSEVKSVVPEENDKLAVHCQYQIKTCERCNQVEFRWVTT